MGEVKEEIAVSADFVAGEKANFDQNKSDWLWLSFSHF